MRKIISILLLTLTWICAAHASSFQWDIFYGRRVHLTIWGQINGAGKDGRGGDGEALRAEILKYIRVGFLPSSINVYTPGGDVNAAMEMGEYIRVLKLPVRAPFRYDDGKIECASARGAGGMYGYVPDDIRCDCASACLLLWAAGMPRVGNYVRVHHPYFNSEYYKSLSLEEAEKAYKPAEDKFRQYLKRMGTPEDIINQTMNVLSNKTVELTPLQINEMQNDEAWLAQKVFDSCGEEISVQNSPQRPAYLDCADKIYTPIAIQSAQRFLDAYGNKSEKVPEKVHGWFE
jgi:hypothetical protein